MITRADRSRVAPRSSPAKTHALRLFRKSFDVRERTEVTERRIGSAPRLSAPRIRVFGGAIERQMKGRIADIAALKLEAVVNELGHGREIVGRLRGNYQHQRILSCTQ